MKDKQMIYHFEDIKEILGIGNNALRELFQREKHPIPYFRIGRRIIVPCDRFNEWLQDEPDFYGEK